MLAFEGFANLTRIIQPGDALLQVIMDTLANLGLEFFDRFMN